jgi:hypothetical protein
MFHHCRERTMLLCLGVILLASATARAQPPNESGTTKLCGLIAGTVVLTENTELVCDVQCQNAPGAPCIQFGADHIWLRLNGFKITGPAAPPAGCVDRGLPLEDGISTNGHDHVQILGPGMVQRFRRHGMFVINSSHVTVKHVTSHHNCFSGLQTASMTDSDIEENVLVRNAIASGPFACGGNCNLNAVNNRIRRNEATGNGSVEVGMTPRGPLPNDFGISLLGTSNGNVVEENGVGGNINGIWLAPLTTGNLIRRNVIAGNPPVQLSPTVVTTVGADIRDFAVPGANIFEENLCITYEGPAAVPLEAAPCATVAGVVNPAYIFPKFAGHRNTSHGSSTSSTQPSSKSR